MKLPALMIADTSDRQEEDKDGHGQKKVQDKEEEPPANINSTEPEP
jgi:hypothetical protein